MENLIDVSPLAWWHACTGKCAACSFWQAVRAKGELPCHSPQLLWTLVDQSSFVPETNHAYVWLWWLHCVLYLDNAGRDQMGIRHITQDMDLLWNIWRRWATFCSHDETHREIGHAVALDFHPYPLLLVALICLRCACSLMTCLYAIMCSKLQDYKLNILKCRKLIIFHVTSTQSPLCSSEKSEKSLLDGDTMKPNVLV